MWAVALAFLVCSLIGHLLSRRFSKEPQFEVPAPEPEHRSATPIGPPLRRVEL